VPTSIDRDELRGLMERGATVVEVLEERQFRSAHLPGAVHMPGWEMTEERVGELDRSRPVVVYCFDNL
jgi:rhodanese-related sulfurtransferase